jgi:ABC-type lipoprotein release transport system permease subunit
VLRRLLFYITTIDTATFVSMPLVLPARRAARVDPAITLRYE